MELLAQYVDKKAVVVVLGGDSVAGTITAVSSEGWFEFVEEDGTINVVNSRYVVGVSILLDNSSEAC